MLKEQLPDITANSFVNNALQLQWVGMEEIAIPITIDLYDQLTHKINAKASIFVSLSEPTAKGIHMSRLHNVLNKLADTKLNKLALDRLLEDSINSQADICKNSRVSLKFDLILEKPSLLSGHSGFQSYPVTISGEASNDTKNYELELTIPYSSTCPCSASLARQLLAKAIDNNFSGDELNKTELLEWIQSEQGSVASPHSQRSYLQLKMTIGENKWPNIQTLIFNLEDVIGTAVQTVVKREDEQEFAKLNGENLMFCEDAARRIKRALEAMPFADDYWFKIEHKESLHAHNAVVIDRKSI